MPRAPHGEPSPDAVMRGKAPFSDPAQKRLVEQEQQEQQNPLKTPPERGKRAAGRVGAEPALPDTGDG